MKVDYKGQQYVCIGTVPHTRRDGTETELAVWRSECATCGEPFEFKSPAAATKFMPNRRCSKHRSPGVYVRTKR